MQGTITAAVAARSRHRVPAPAPVRFGGPGPTRVSARLPGVTGGRAGNLGYDRPQHHARDPTTSPSATAPLRALDGASFTARRGRLVGLPGPERRRQDDDDALHLRARDARLRRRPLGRRPDRRRDPAAVRVHARAARPLPADARRGAARVLRPAPRAVAARTRGTKSGEWLERFGLADRAKSKLEDLSHGNQQRVQLATALVHDPELLVLDEPFSGLDPIGIATMSGVLRERAAAGVGVVFSSHQLDLVEEVCEDVVIISRGRVVAEGGIEELKARSGRRHLDVEVAGSGGAWLDATNHHTVLERDGDRVRLLVDETRGPRRAAGRRARGGRGPPVQLRAAASCRSCSWRRSRRPSRRPDGQLLEAVREPPARDPARRRCARSSSAAGAAATSCRSCSRCSCCASGSSSRR